MPKKCEYCEFFDPENHLSECPNCGQPLQFTMFTPPGYETEEPDEFDGAAPWSEHLAPYEEMELPWGMRWAQIGAGIGAYFVISRTAMNCLSTLFVVSSNGAMETEEYMLQHLVLVGVFYVLGAIVGGAVAGAWSINWIPQGLGVGIGVFTVPIVILVAFPPEHPMIMGLFAAVLCVTTVLAVFGAYLGHKIIRPFRYVIS